MSKRLRTIILASVATVALGLAPAAWAGVRRAYFGGFTPPSDPALVGNRAEGITVADVDSETGKITNVRLAAKTLSPSWLTVSPNGKVLYAANEVAVFGPNKSGSVSAFAIQSDGSLTPLNVVDSGGAIACHISIDPSGKFAFVANYDGGTFAVYRLEADGRFGEMTQLIRPTPVAGSTEPGSPRAHQLQFDPTGRYVVGNDTGNNQTIVWTFDPLGGKLTEVSRVSTGPRTGPRHFVFSPDGKTLYQIMQSSSELAVYDVVDGKLSKRGENISALPDGWAGSNSGSELLISKDGRRLYSGNRLHDSIATFAVAGNGKVTRISNVHTQGHLPRSLALDPDGRFLYSMNQRANNVTTFRIGPDGVPVFTGQFLPQGSPAVMVFAGASSASQ